MQTNPSPPPESVAAPRFLSPLAVAAGWVVPVAALLALNLSTYRTVAGALNPAQRIATIQIGAALLANLLLGVACCVFAFRHRSDEANPGHARWNSAMILAQLGYFALVLFRWDAALPLRQAGWMLGDDATSVTQFMLGMVPLLLGMIRIAAGGKVKRGLGEVLRNALIAIAVPALIYFAAVGGKTARSVEVAWSLALSVTIVGGGLMFLFAVVRVLLFVLRQFSRRGVWAARLGVFLLAVALPLAGLALNTSIPFPADFQSWETYALLAANAVALFAATIPRVPAALRLGLLALTAPFTLYFFVVFLPCLPLAILAMLFFGAGLLILAPLLLLGLHVFLAQRAWNEAAARGVGKLRLSAIAFAALLALPGWFLGNALLDRAVLAESLDQAFHPEIAAGDLRVAAHPWLVRRVLQNQREFQNGAALPFLTATYADLVFDRLVLPEAKLAELERLFTDPGALHDARRRHTDFWGNSARPRRRRGSPPPRTDWIKQFTARASADDRVTLAWTINNADNSPAEYVAPFRLPPGVFIAGFRMTVNGRLESGRIHERKSAEWVYQSIRDLARRDPGLVTIEADGSGELRIFPIMHGAPTNVELELLLPVPPRELKWPPGETEPAAWLNALAPQLPPAAALTPQGVRLSGSPAALGLPIADPEIFLHVIVDRSARTGFTGNVSAALDQLHARFPATTGVRLTLANYDVVELAAARTAWSALPEVDEPTLQRRLPRRGGFAADLALAQAACVYGDRELSIGSSTLPPPPAPVIIVLTEMSDVGVFLGIRTRAWRDRVGEWSIVAMNRQLALRPVTTPSVSPRAWVRSGPALRPWLGNNSVEFPAAERSSAIEFWSPAENAWRPLSLHLQSAKDSAWGRAAELQLRSGAFARAEAHHRDSLAQLVDASRAAGVLVPQTSFIVVENAAQQRALEDAEKRKLRHNSALEFVETPAPGFWLLGGGLILVGLARRRSGLLRRAACC